MHENSNDNVLQELSEFIKEIDMIEIGILTYY